MYNKEGLNIFSREIDRFVEDEKIKLNRNLELATKNYMDEYLEKRFINVSADLDKLRKVEKTINERDTSKKSDNGKKRVTDRKRENILGAIGKNFKNPLK